VDRAGAVTVPWVADRAPTTEDPVLLLSDPDIDRRDDADGLVF
jgi:hypothetical protein